MYDLDASAPTRRSRSTQQVKRLVMEGIRNGEYAGARLPSETHLVERLNVSRMTVHRALRELKAEGVIVRVPGRGTFVSEEKPRTTLLETQDIAEEIRGRGSRLVVPGRGARRRSPPTGTPPPPSG